MELRTFLKVGNDLFKILLRHYSQQVSPHSRVHTLVRVCRSGLCRSKGGRPICDRVDPRRSASLSHGRAADHLRIRPPAERSAGARRERKSHQAGPEPIKSCYEGRNPSGDCLTGQASTGGHHRLWLTDSLHDSHMTPC